jgi:hypothetical protein
MLSSATHRGLTSKFSKLAGVKVLGTRTTTIVQITACHSAPELTTLHTRAMLLSAVDYRLAPEHPFPAALDDAISVYEWLIDPQGGVRRYEPPRLVSCTPEAVVRARLRACVRETNDTLTKGLPTTKRCHWRRLGRRRTDACHDAQVPVFLCTLVASQLSRTSTVLDSSCRDRARDQGMPLPSAIVCLSPWVRTHDQ